jgi:hypothetical protein
MNYTSRNFWQNGLLARSRFRLLRQLFAARQSSANSKLAALYRYALPMPIACLAWQARFAGPAKLAAFKSSNLKGMTKKIQ